VDFEDPYGVAAIDRLPTLRDAVAGVLAGETGDRSATGLSTR